MGNYIKTRTGMAYELDEENYLLLIEVKKNFTSEDFYALQKFIDDCYDKRGEFNGVIINAKKFPYWKGAENRNEYFSFARNNHYKFKRVALTMNGFFAKIIKTFANGRAHPQIANFKYNQIDEAFTWLMS